MIGIVSIAAAVLAICGVAVWYAVAAPESQWLGPVFARGPSESRAVALTFDDGPGEQTSAILDILRECGVRATFFLCGSNVERFPALSRRIADDGHGIGNHTDSHLRLLGRSPGRIALEIDRAQRVILHRTGSQPSLFRPPYGLRWFGLFPILARSGLKTVMWSVNSLDWRLNARQIAERVLGQARAGSIILLHDGVPPRERGDRSATVEALPEILRELQARYRLVTVSELLSAATPARDDQNSP